jgi:hypothetical protein
MNRTQHKNVKKNSFYPLTRSVSDIRAFFEGTASNNHSPQLVKYKRHDSTYRSSEDITIYSPPRLNNQDRIVSCPNSPLQQLTANPAMEISNLISNMTKAAADIVGAGQQSSKETVSRESKPKILKQATLTFEGRIEGTGQSTISTPVSSTPTAHTDSTPQQNMTANSFLTASTTDTPLSDHGSWATEQLEEQVLLSDIPGEGLKQHTEVYVDPTTIPEALRGVTPLASVTLAPGATTTSTPSTGGGVKRSLPFNTPVKSGSASRGKAKKKEGKKSVQSSSADDSHDDSPPPVETVRKKQQTQNSVTPPPHHQMEGGAATATVAAPVDRDIEMTGIQENAAQLNIQEQLNSLAQRMDSLQLLLEQRVGGVQDNLNVVVNDMRRMNDDIGQLNNDHLTALVTWQKTNAAVFELQDDRTKHTDKINNIEGTVQRHGAEIIGINAEISGLAKNQAEMKASIADIYKRVSAATAAGGAGQQDDQASSLFIGGLKQLRRWVDDYDSDPAELVADLLRHLRIYNAVMRISLADNDSRAEGNRMTARAVIVVMSSQMHRRDAIIKIKRYLNEERKNGLEGVTAGDCFPHDTLSRVRIMGRYATAKKKEGKFYRFRIINRNGTPILQISKRNKPFEDANFTEEELAPYAEESRMDTDDPSDRQQNKQQPHGPTTGANNQPIGQQQQENKGNKGAIPKKGQNQQQQQTQRQQQLPQRQQQQPQRQQREDRQQQTRNQQQAPQPVVPQPVGTAATAAAPPQQPQQGTAQLQQQAPTPFVPQPGGNISAPFPTQQQQIASYRTNQQQQYGAPAYNNPAVNNNTPYQQDVGPGEMTAGFRNVMQLPPGMGNYIQQAQQGQLLAPYQLQQGYVYYPAQQLQEVQQHQQLHYRQPVSQMDNQQPAYGGAGAAGAAVAAGAAAPTEGATRWSTGGDPNRHLSRDG